jgi:hypothetical protein
MPASAAYTDTDFSISVATGRRLLSSRRENTERAYGRNWTQSTEWCAETGRTPLHAPQACGRNVDPQKVT